jgi:hypothetical protein
MKVVLIPCSERKIKAGETTYEEPKLKLILGDEAYKDLLRARNNLSSVLGLRPGPDISGGVRESGLQFMPAYRRYRGIMYQEAEFVNLFPNFKGKIFIVSALYGLLEANDFIRNYNLKMNDKLGSGEKVWKWWIKKGLGHYLNIALSNSVATEVHNLLTQDYRKAIGSWQEKDRYKIIEYNYPGLGIGSLYRRREDLKRILSPRT